MIYSLEHLQPEPLSIKRLVQCLHELSLAKCSQLIVNGFISEEIDDMLLSYVQSNINKLLLLSFCIITDVYVLW